MTVGHVIRLLDTLFHAHIRDEWKPRMLTSLQPLIKEREDRIAALGTLPEKLRVQNVVKAAIDLVTIDGTHLTARLPFTKARPGFAHGSDERARYSSMIAQQEELLTKMPEFIGKMAPKVGRPLSPPFLCCSLSATTACCDSTSAYPATRSTYQPLHLCVVLLMSCGYAIILTM